MNLKPALRGAALTMLTLAATGAVAAAPKKPPCWPSCAAPNTAGDRYLHVMDVRAITRPFLTPQGFMDPAFPPTIAFASPYDTDFFGVQAIADVSMGQIVADFVPKYASETARDDHSVTLMFKGGYTATFYPKSSLQVLGVSAPISHVVVSGADWRAIHAHVTDFTAMLKTAGLAAKYLIPNPFYADERVTAAQLASGRAAPIIVDPNLALFESRPDAILLAPEGVHGMRADADRLIEILKTHKVDWLGMEMLNASQQQDLDAFNRAKEGTAAYKAARAKLVDYFADAWNGRAGPKTSGEDNYYFQIVETAHHNGTRVIGLEGSDTPFIFFRYGETNFGASVRSHLWALHAPSHGRGIIFGGGAHFNSPGSANAQDFIAARDRGRTFVSVKPITKPAG